MALSFQFARRRDRTLRLHVLVTGADVDAFEQVIGGCARFRRVGATDWEIRHVVEHDRIAGFAATLRTGPAALHAPGADISAAHERLVATPAPAPRPVGVIDDPAIRAAVRARPVPDGALVIDELGIGAGQVDPWLEVRADLAVLLEGEWAGVELKGERDSLTRLPRQVVAYSATFDRCELVTTTHHVHAAQEAVPPWWAVTLAQRTTTGGLELVPVREGGRNPDPDPLARMQLLWRDEALHLLRDLGQARGRSSHLRWQLWQALTEVTSTGQGRRLVTAALSARQGWLSQDGAARVWTPGRRT